MKNKLTLSILTTLILTFIISCSQPIAIPANHKMLELEISNKKYEKLTLFTYLRMPEGYDNEVDFLGKSEDGYKWTFIVPDSVNERAEGYLIRVESFDFEKNEDNLLSFETKGTATLKDSRVVLKDSLTIIKGDYTHSFSVSTGDLAHILVDTFVMSPTIVHDVYKLK